MLENLYWGAVSTGISIDSKCVFQKGLGLKLSKEGNIFEGRIVPQGHTLRLHRVF